MCSDLQLHLLPYTGDREAAFRPVSDLRLGPSADEIEAAAFEVAGTKVLPVVVVVGGQRRERALVELGRQRRHAMLMRLCEEIVARLDPAVPDRALHVLFPLGGVDVLEHRSCALYVGRGMTPVAAVEAGVVVEGFLEGGRQGRAEVSESEGPSNGKGATMLLKRSVSPDGRIDSLSVEFSFPVGKGTTKDVRLKAMKTLKLQGEITAGFLAQNGRTETDSDHTHEDHRNGNGNENGTPDGAEPAKMLEIGGINTKWGRRLFISFQVNGDMLKLFGNRKRLEEVLTAVGQSKLAKRLEEGLKINAACLVTTKESGQYTNIDEVFPYEKPTASRGRR